MPLRLISVGAIIVGVAIEADTLSVGANILGHDCIAVGSVILTQGALE